MKKQLYFIFVAACLALLVSSPGRLVYGIVLVVEMNVLALGSGVFCILIKKAGFENLYDILTLSFIIFLTILYKQILILYSPILALNLGFVMFFPAVSVFLLGNIFTKKALNLANVLKQSFGFSFFALLFFALRDILGYGTISLPAKNGIYERFLFDSHSTAFLSFFASIPGALLLVVLCMVALLSVQYKMNIIEKAGFENGND